MIVSTDGYSSRAGLSFGETPSSFFTGHVPIAPSAFSFSLFLFKKKGDSAHVLDLEQMANNFNSIISQVGLWKIKTTVS